MNLEPRQHTLSPSLRCSKFFVAFLFVIFILEVPCVSSSSGSSGTTLAFASRHHQRSSRSVRIGMRRLAFGHVFHSQTQSIIRHKFPLQKQAFPTMMPLSSTLSSGGTVIPSNPLETLGLPSPLILGSGSFTRKLILGEMNIPFHLLVKSIDEKSIGDRMTDPRNLVLTLAKAKADHLVSELSKSNSDLTLPPTTTTTTSEGWIILTADQVVIHADYEGVLEKPESIEEARTFVKSYERSPPSTVGACVLTHYPSNVQVSGVDSATIHFSETQLNKYNTGKEDLIDQLLSDGAPVLDCAGGLMVEHPLVQDCLDHLEGTQDSVMGLSKDLVWQLLSEMKEKLSSQE
jgi:septum formation protein